MFNRKIPFKLTGVFYYRVAGGGEIMKYDFLEAKAEKILPIDGHFFDNSGFIFSFSTLTPSPYRTFRLTKYNLKGEIIEEWELPTTHPIWWSCTSSLSPDQNLVAGMREIVPSQFDRFKLVVSPLNRLDEKVIAEDLGGSGMVWISNTELLYKDINGETFQIDINTKKKQKFGFKGIFIGPLSPDGKYRLCSKKHSPFYELDAIYLLHVPDMKLNKLTRFPGFGGGGIWSPDSKYFIFSKLIHPLISLLHGNFEMEDVYVYSLEHKRAYQLFEDTFLGGGVWLKEEVK